MFFSKLSREGRTIAALLPDLEGSVQPIASDDDSLQVRRNEALRVRTNLRAGDDGGQGSSGTDRSNIV